MNILETLLNAPPGAGLQQTGWRLGLRVSDIQALLRQLVPELAGGLGRNASTFDGLEALTRALAGGNHQRYIDDAGALANAVPDGNAILGHLFGSKDVSRNVASRAAATTGIDADTIEKFMPVVAAAVMGALSKQTAGGSSSSGGSLTTLLDPGDDGIELDDLRSLGKKFFCALRAPYC